MFKMISLKRIMNLCRIHISQIILIKNIYLQVKIHPFNKINNFGKTINHHNYKKIKLVC